MSMRAHGSTKGTLREFLPIGHAGTVVLAQRDAAHLAPAFTGHIEADDLTGELPERTARGRHDSGHQAPLIDVAPLVTPSAP